MKKNSAKNSLNYLKFNIGNKMEQNSTLGKKILKNVYFVG